MTRSMQGLTVLITGGGGHIGRATGTALAEKGANLAVLDKADTTGFCAEIRDTYGVKAEQIDAEVQTVLFHLSDLTRSAGSGNLEILEGSDRRCWR